MPDEIRRDFLGREVIVSSTRSKRPKDLQSSPAERQICPFCPGNESMTTKTILALPDEKNWQVRVFSNKFPVLSSSEIKCKKTGLYQTCTPYGRHEILVETREHDRDYENMGTDNLELALLALKQRYCELIKLKGINYVTIFKNKGLAAGASLRHTHTQIIASPMFPETVSRDMDDAESFFKKDKRCGLCVMLDEEIKDGKRIVASNSHWTCFAPFTSVWPYQVKIVPKRHFSELSEMNYEELKSLAKMLSRIFSSFSKVFNDMPYNMMYRNFPRSELWHFHITIFPRLVTQAGFEFFGLNVNVAPPEQAAKDLRKSMKA